MPSKHPLSLIQWYTIFPRTKSLDEAQLMYSADEFVAAYTTKRFWRRRWGHVKFSPGTMPRVHASNSPMHQNLDTKSRLTEYSSLNHTQPRTPQNPSITMLLLLLNISPSLTSHAQKQGQATLPAWSFGWSARVPDTADPKHLGTTHPKSL